MSPKKKVKSEEEEGGKEECEKNEQDMKHPMKFKIVTAEYFARGSDFAALSPRLELHYVDVPLPLVVTRFRQVVRKALKCGEFGNVLLVPGFKVHEVMDNGEFNETALGDEVPLDNGNMYVVLGQKYV